MYLEKDTRVASIAVSMATSAHAELHEAPDDGFCIGAGGGNAGFKIMKHLTRFLIVGAIYFDICISFNCKVILIIHCLFRLYFDLLEELMIVLV